MFLQVKVKKKTFSVVFLGFVRMEKINCPVVNCNLSFTRRFNLNRHFEKSHGKHNWKQTLQKKPVKKEIIKDGKKYNDKHVDLNLYIDAPENIIQTTVKLSPTIMMMSKMIEVNDEKKGLTCNMAALVITRKLKNGNKFEFNLPLSMACEINLAIDFIMQKNKKFFKTF